MKTPPVPVASHASTSARHQGVVRTPGPTITGRHLTIAELCIELGVARSTFYDWRAKGASPRCMKLPNGELRIRRIDLDTWLTTLEDGAA
jgi:predicted DNA-binding transcriptional regulator AlpA